MTVQKCLPENEAVEKCAGDSIQAIRDVSLFCVSSFHFHFLKHSFVKFSASFGKNAKTSKSETEEK